jgi:hypothetical protein
MQAERRRLMVAATNRVRDQVFRRGYPFNMGRSQRPQRDLWSGSVGFEPDRDGPLPIWLSVALEHKQKHATAPVVDPLT